MRQLDRVLQVLRARRGLRVHPKDQAGLLGQVNLLGRVVQQAPENRAHR